MGAPAPGNGGLHFPRNATAHRAAQTILHLPQWSRAKPQQVAGVRGLYGLVPPLFLSAISYVEDSVAADATDTTLRRSLRVFMLWYLRATCRYDGVRYLRRQPIAVRTRGRWHRLQPTRSPVMGCRARALLRSASDDEKWGSNSAKRQSARDNIVRYSRSWLASPDEYRLCTSKSIPEPSFIVIHLECRGSTADTNSASVYGAIQTISRHFLREDGARILKSVSRRFHRHWIHARTNMLEE